MARPRRRTLTFGVTVAGQAAVPLPLSVEAVLAPLTARAIRVVHAVEAAESVPGLSVQLRIEDTLPGLPTAITHWGAGRGDIAGRKLADNSTVTDINYAWGTK